MDNDVELFRALLHGLPESDRAVLSRRVSPNLVVSPQQPKRPYRRRNPPRHAADVPVSAGSGSLTHGS